MTVGDDIVFTEELYQQIIGKYATTIEVLIRRLTIKDQRITELETQLIINAKPGKKKVEN